MHIRRRWRGSRRSSAGCLSDNFGDVIGRTRVGGHLLIDAFGNGSAAREKSDDDRRQRIEFRHSISFSSSQRNFDIEQSSI